MAEGDAERYVQIASLAAFTVAGLCLLAWLFRLSVLVTLISDSILVGFKMGAGLTIAMTQLPNCSAWQAAVIISSSASISRSGNSGTCSLSCLRSA